MVILKSMFTWYNHLALAIHYFLTRCVCSKYFSRVQNRIHEHGFKNLQHWIFKCGFLGIRSNTSLFIKQANGHVVLVLSYEDNVMSKGYCPKQLQMFFHDIHEQFSLKDISHLSFFLGIEVAFSSQGLHFSKARYVKELFNRFGMSTSKLASTSIVSRGVLSKYGGTMLDDPSVYMSIVGAL